MKTHDLLKLLPKKSLFAITILLIGIIGLFFATNSIGIRKVQKVYNVHVPILERSSIALRLKDKLSISLTQIIWTKNRDLIEEYQLVREFLQENQNDLTKLTNEAGEKLDFSSLKNRFAFEDKIIQTIQSEKWVQAKKMLKDPYYLQAKASSDEALTALAENLSWRRIQFLESQENDLFNSLLILTVFSLLLAGLVTNIARSFVLNAKKLTETQRQLQKERDLRKDQEKFISLGKMAGGLAHEFNNPLMIISAKSQNLERFIERLDPKSHPKADKAIRNVKSIYQTVKRITSISQALLTLSGSTTHREVEAIDIEELIAEVLNSYKAEYDPQLSFQVQMNTGATSQYHLLAVRSEVKSCLYHIFANAVEANYRLKKSLVRLETRVCEHQLTLSVIDQGEGIKPELEDSIFEPFITSKTVGEGMGLGLSLAKTLANQNHASVQYKRSNNETHFRIVFAESAFTMKQSKSKRAG